MYKWKVSRGRSGAYWKVLWSIKSFSRVIITRHWFKPISPDDSSSLNFWRLHEASSICSIDDPNALRVGRRQLDAQKNAPRRLSSLICLTRLLIRGSYLYINNIIWILSSRYLESIRAWNWEWKNFFERKSTNRTQVQVKVEEIF